MAILYALIHGSEQETEIRSEFDLRSLVANLDGAKVSMISLRRENDDSHFTLAGGPSRMIVGWDRRLDPPYLTLLTRSPPDGPVDLVTGGQLADYEAEVAVTPAEAVEAALEFMKTGEATPLFGWREE